MVPYLTFNTAESQKRLRALVSMEEKLFAKLLLALRSNVDTFANRAALVEYADANMTEDAREFVLAVEAVMPFLLNDHYAGNSAEEIAKGVIDALPRIPKPVETFTVTDKRLLRARLRSILTDSTTRLRTRAWSLVLERPCLLETARILTDLRPVFTEKNPAAVEACSVIHTLVLNCQESGESKVMHVALDTSDLSTLKAAIARAEQKEKALNALASKAGVLSLKIT